MFEPNQPPWETSDCPLDGALTALLISCGMFSGVWNGRRVYARERIRTQNAAHTQTKFIIESAQSCPLVHKLTQRLDDPNATDLTGVPIRNWRNNGPAPGMCRRVRPFQ